MKNKLNKRFVIYISDEQFDEIKRAAANKGLPVTTYARYIILRRIREVSNVKDDD